MPNTKHGQGGKMFKVKENGGENPFWRSNGREWMGF